MTDFQFKSIVKMILEILEKSDDKEDAIKALRELLYGEEEVSKDEEK